MHLNGKYYLFNLAVQCDATFPWTRVEFLQDDQKWGII